MAARYATSTFVIQLAGGASHLVVIGSLRDSAHGAVTGNASAFSTTPVIPADPRLAAYIAAYPSGP